MSVARLKNRVKSTVQNITNQVFGDLHYQKFVIISRSRTGSTLLMSLLNSHENIECTGEIFKELKGKPSNQVWFNHFGKRLKRIKWLGFRLFYYHPINGDREVWELLKSDSSIPVLHLTRQNMLRTLVSQRIGMKTNKWTKQKDEEMQAEPSDKRISLTVEECESFFDETKAYENETRKAFSSHQIIEVSYENLVANRDSCMNSVYKGLGTSISLATTNRKKQNPEPLPDLVKNYNELKAHFTSTKWAPFFELPVC